MIALIIQIKSLIFSFFYGLFLAILLNLNYKYIYKSKRFYRILINILFVISNVLLYFIVIKLINNGIVHPYFIFMIIIGFSISNYQLKRLTFKRKTKNIIEKMVKK